MVKMTTKKAALKEMVDLTERARLLLIDARVAGAVSGVKEAYHLSLLVGAAETHVSVLHAHLWGELNRA